MYYRAESIFYALASFVIFTAAFVLAPSAHEETRILQTEVREQFRVAFIQTMGDQPYFEEAEIIFDGIRDFYIQSADSAIALFKHEEADRDLAYIFKGMVLELARVATMYLPEPQTLASVAESNQELPEAVILPRVVAPAGMVSGEVLLPSVANTYQAWVTIQDNMTGQLFCVAIYNGEVNKYLGECVDEYY